MKYALIISTIIAATGYGQMINVNSGQVMMSSPVQVKAGQGIIDNPTQETLYSLGWRPAARSIITNTVIVEIPQAIQQVAAAYKQAMESIYGQGAVTNRLLTREAVAIDLSLRPPEEVSADTGLRLSTWFEILNAYWAKGEVWSFPYGDTSYEMTTREEVWEAVP